MTVIRRLALLAALAFVMGADKPEPEPAPVKPPGASIRGEVKTVTPVKVKGLIGRLLVEGAKEKDTQVDSARVGLKAGGKVYFWKDGKKAEATFKDIKPGCVVQVDFVGIVRESLPVQADTMEVLILSTPKKK